MKDSLGSWFEGIQLIIVEEARHRWLHLKVDPCDPSPSHISTEQEAESEQEAG